MKLTGNQNFRINFLASVLLLVFAYTVSSKLMAFPRFVGTLSQSLPDGVSPALLAGAILLSEIIVAVLLAVPDWRYYGFCMAVVLLSLFSLYIGYLLLSRSTLPCTCGGILEILSWRSHLFVNLLLLAFAVAGARGLKRNQLFIAINRRSRKPVNE